MQVGGFYAVEPKRNCPHTEAVDIDLGAITVDEAKKFLTDKCGNCDSTEENWICLACGFLGCSRYVSGHMAAHNESTGHPLAISFSDLSCWCYECDSYIISPAISAIHSMLYLAKFEKLPPNVVYNGVRPSNVSQPQGINRRVTYPDPVPVQYEEPSEVILPASKAHGHLSNQEIQEYKDLDEVLQAKITEFGQVFKDAKRVVVFTGAGISTSAKIPDYRGPKGVWTMRDRGLQATSEIRIEEARPTPAHRAIKALAECSGKPVFVVSTNVDGLHLRSGLNRDALSELHGNIYREVCCLCGSEVIRDFPVEANPDAPVDLQILKGREFDRTRLSHRTGRRCLCGGYFCDDIINFGESMPPGPTQKAVTEASKADLAIVLGTSMRVAPANRIPEMVFQNNGKLIITNLQKTPFDDLAEIRFWGSTDDVMVGLLQQLNIPLPPE
jgi:NAD-dependent SIR2 family protein deacetylase